MATRTRDSTTPSLKEKRGTSPSAQAVSTQQRRGSPNPLKTNSPARTRDPTTTATEKKVPNYLRHTASSGLDVSKQQGKKPVSSTDTAATHKPALSRRRSFDKPPSTQKSRVSPNPTLRSSSSFSGKTVGSLHHKPVVEKNTKAPAKDAAGRQHGLYARPVGAVKKSSSVQVKKQSETGGSKSATKEQVTSPAAEKVDNLSIPEPEMPESCTSESEEEAVAALRNDDRGCKEFTTEDQEQVKNVEQMEDVSDDKDATIVTVDPPTVSEHGDASLETKTEDKQENEPNAEEISSEKHEAKEDSAADEINNTITDESVASNPINEDVEEKHKEEEEKANEREEPVATASEAHTTEEKEVQQVAVVEEKHEAEKSPPPKVQVIAHGKRDSAVSNDVIEETASKLREQRKNKVKALAGAFETVISLQEPK